MNTISKIPDSTIQVYFPRSPINRSPHQTSWPSVLLSCTRCVLQLLALIVMKTAGYDSPLSYTILIIIPFCIIVEIDGSEISLYTA